jgi:energy-converting hydrogenase Eha subunit G
VVVQGCKDKMGLVGGVIAIAGAFLFAFAFYGRRVHSVSLGGVVLVCYLGWKAFLAFMVSLFVCAGSAVHCLSLRNCNKRRV